MKSSTQQVSAFLVVVAVGVSSAWAQETAPVQGERVNPQVDAGLTIQEASTLDELLELVREKRIVENELHEQREAEFRSRTAEQQGLLDDAKAELRREEQRSQSLDTQMNDNETEISNQQQILDERLGSLRELFGVLTQVAGDTRGVFNGSIVSAEYPDRGTFLGDLAVKMGTASELATIDEMEHLWELLLQHLNETGKVTRFDGVINMTGGEQLNEEILRVGSFNVVAGEGYVNYDVSTGSLTQLARQPSGEYSNTARSLYRSDPGDVTAFAIDPTRGQLLSLETQRATVGEMVGSPFKGIANGQCWLPFCDGNGGMVGSVIILVGIVGVLLAIERLIMLFLISRKVAAQKKAPGEPKDDNPLGRVIGIYHANTEVDNETLQLKMGEAVLQETPLLTRNIAIVQVISVVAPLMGLLGTVIGMIQTFEAITLFGTGDPKIMASGISTALMTTVLGLCVAIPTVLLHALIAQYSRSVLHVLDEQSEGMIAAHAESTGQPITEVKSNE